MRKTIWGLVALGVSVYFGLRIFFAVIRGDVGEAVGVGIILAITLAVIGLEGTGHGGSWGRFARKKKPVGGR